MEDGARKMSPDCTTVAADKIQFHLRHLRNHSANKTHTHRIGTVHGQEILPVVLTWHSDPVEREDHQPGRPPKSQRAKLGEIRGRWRSVM